MSYLVASFESKDDKVIGDILKKIPGIEVSENGRIAYNGVNINKFYIENLDVLQGRYNIATKNIQAKDVATVEIFEYHQPIKVLRKSNPSDQAAINLKLKPQAKGTFSLLARLGLGYKPLIWDNELISLYFSKKFHNINTYKGNNIGIDVAKEFTSFYSDILYFSNNKVLSVLFPSTPPISSKRHLFNNTHALSANVLKSLKEDHTLTTNIVYFNDFITKDNSSKSVYYYSSDSVLTIYEDINDKINKNNLEATIKYEVNKDDYFLTNSLNINGKWENENALTQTLQNVYQHLNTNTYSISNKFELIQNFGSLHQVRFFSNTGYNKAPQNMLIKSDIYNNLFDSTFQINTAQQCVDVDNITSKNNISYMTNKHGLYQFYSIGFNATVQRLNTDLQFYNDQTNLALNNIDSLKNNVLSQQYNPYAKVDLSYQWNRFTFKTALPLNYQLLIIKDSKEPESQIKNKIQFNPSLDIKYKIDNDLTLNATYSHFNFLGNIQNIYTNYILKNYRFLNRYDGKIADNKSDMVYFNLAYRNVPLFYFLM